MNLDKTFCTGKRCPKTDSCDRYLSKLKAFLEKPEGEKFKTKLISIADFSDHDGKCRLESK